MKKTLLSVLACSFSLNLVASEAVSIYQVLGNPSNFNSKQISVAGVLGVLDGDIVVLFPDSERRSNKVLIDGIVLSGGYSNGAVGTFGKDEVLKLDGKFVVVDGVYHYAAKGVRLYSGGISDVTALHPVTKIPARSAEFRDDEKAASDAPQPPSK